MHHWWGDHSILESLTWRNQIRRLELEGTLLSSFQNTNVSNKVITTALVAAPAYEL